MADLETASQQLTDAANSLNQASGERLEAASEKLGNAAEVSYQSQMEVTERLEETLGQIQDLRTQELTARLTVAGGVVEGVEAPVADIGQLEAFAAQMEAYVNRVADIQNVFVRKQAERNEGLGAYNEMLGETTEKLQAGTEQLTTQAEKVQKLKQASGAAENNFGQMAQQQQGGRDLFETWAAGAEGVAGSMEVAGTATKTASQGARGANTALMAASEAAEGMNRSLLTAANVISTGIAVAVGAVVERFLDLNEQTQNFIDQTGIAASRASRMRSQLANMTPRLRAAGLEISDMVEAQVALTEKFGSFRAAAAQLDSTFAGIQDPAKALRAEITQVAGRLRMSGQEAAEMIASFEQLSSSTGMSRQNLQASAMHAAQVAEVAPKQVMQDIAENSEQLAKFSGMSGEELAAAAAQARNLGTNIGEVAELNEQILTDIPGFVQGLEKARALAPQIGLNPQQLTAAAAQGPKALTAELEEQFQNVDVGDMDFFTKQRLSEAFGMSVQQLTKISERADEATMSTGQLAEKVQEGNASMQRMFQATNAQTAFTELQNQLSALVGTLSVALVPVFRTMADVVRAVLVPVKSLVSWARQAAHRFQEWTRTLGPFGQTVKGVVEAFAGIAGVAATWQSFVNVVGIVSSSLASYLPTIGSLTGAISSMSSAIVGFMSTVSSQGLIAALSSVLPSALTTAGSAVVGFATTLGATGIGGILLAIGAAVSGAVIAFNNWNATVAFAKSTLDTFIETVLGVEDGFGALEAAAAGIGSVIGGLGTAFSSLLDFLGPVGSAIGGFVGYVSQFVASTDVARESAVSFGDVVGTVLAAPFYAVLTPMRLAIDLIQSIPDAVDFAASAFDTLSGAVSSALRFVSSIPSRLGSLGADLLDALIPDPAVLKRKMNAFAKSIRNYLPFSPAKVGPLSDLDQVNLSGEIAKTIQPEPVQAQMESTMGQATQAATEGVQGAEIQQANQVQVDGGTATAQVEAAELPEGIIPLLKKISNHEKKILQALQNMDVDAYLDSKKVTDKLRKENNKNTMKTV